MSKKEIITLVIACTVIGVAVYFIITMIYPNAKKTGQKAGQGENVQTIPAEVDDTTYKSINTLSDYGKPELSGIGKSDLFAGF